MQSATNTDIIRYNLKWYDGAYQQSMDIVSKEPVSVEQKGRYIIVVHIGLTTELEFIGQIRWELNSPNGRITQ